MKEIINTLLKVLMAFFLLISSNEFFVMIEMIYYARYLNSTHPVNEEERPAQTPLIRKYCDLVECQCKGDSLCSNPPHTGYLQRPRLTVTLCFSVHPFADG